MGQSYGGVGGIGIEFTECIAQAAISVGKLSEEDWDDDSLYAVEELGFKCNCAGVYDTDKIYVFVDGNNLTQINKNKDSFINNLSKIGTQIQESDLEVISDIYVS